MPKLTVEEKIIEAKAEIKDKLEKAMKEKGSASLFAEYTSLVKGQVKGMADGWRDLQAYTIDTYVTLMSLLPPDTYKGIAEALAKLVIPEYKPEDPNAGLFGKLEILQKAANGKIKE